MTPLSPIKECNSSPPPSQNSGYEFTTLKTVDPSKIKTLVNRDPVEAIYELNRNISLISEETTSKVNVDCENVNITYPDPEPPLTTKHLEDTFQNGTLESTLEEADMTMGDVVDTTPEVDLTRKNHDHKGHACLYCDKVIINLARHLSTAHQKEIEVAKLLAMDKKSKLRRDGFIALGRKGDFFFNMQVLATQKGDLILARKPSKKEMAMKPTYKDYGPCPDCLGFMLKKHIWLHSRDTCCNRKTDKHSENRRYIEESNVLMVTALKTKDFSEGFLTDIVSKFISDDVTSIVKQDELILRFGELKFEKFGST